jgi:hypothetical protein
VNAGWQDLDLLILHTAEQDVTEEEPGMKVDPGNSRWSHAYTLHPHMDTQPESTRAVRAVKREAYETERMLDYILLVESGIHDTKEANDLRPDGLRMISIPDRVGNAIDFRT